MKKLFLLLTLLLCLSAVPVSAENEVTVLIPDYDFVINNSLVYYQDSLYPVLSYKDVTYFPMTYDYCRALNMTTSWVEGEGLFIAAHPSSAAELPIYETRSNKKYNKAVKASYDIYINGEKTDAEAAEYPLLNFRGVTYFPLTYEYATEEFYWNIDFTESGKRCLTVSSFFHGNGSTMTIEEQTGEYAVIRNPEGDNFYRIDFKTDEITVLNDYSAPERSNRTELDNEHTLEIADNRFVLDGTPLAEIKALVNGETTPDDLSASYSEYIENGVQVLKLHVYYNLNIPAPYTPFENYTYIYHNGQYVLGPVKSYVEKVVPSGDNIYISSVRYTGFRGTSYLHRDLYMLKPDGSMIYVNDMFPDYNSFELIGQSGGKLYLKCLWMPEKSAMSLSNEYSVSSYNDGYFTFDGEKLSLLRQYTYSNKAVVSPDGKIYVTVEQFGKIKRIY